MAAEILTEERQAAWWAEWREEDYSWGGLAQKPLKGWFVEDGLLSDAKSGRIYGGVNPEKRRSAKGVDATIQDYWRADPATGRLRSDFEMADELVARDGQPTYHRIHLPVVYADRTATDKSTWTRVALNLLLGDRVRIAANEVGASGGEGPGMRRADWRVQLRGGVLLAGVKGPPGKEDLLHIDCSSAAFVGSALFNGATLSEDSTFDNAAFFDRAYFDDVVFLGGMRFAKGTFFGDVSFERATSSGDSFFYAGTFLGEASFSQTTFSKRAAFSRLVANGPVSFDRTSFLGYTSFTGSGFVRGAGFASGKFLDDVNFGSAKFSGPTNFRHVLFAAEAIFKLANFAEDAAFDHAIFQSDAKFEGVDFEKAATFRNCNFSGTSVFKNATFGQSSSGGSVDFTAVTFARLVSFEQITWPLRAQNWHQAFNQAHFQNTVNVTGAGFKAFAAFDGATFERGIQIDEADEPTAKRTFRQELKAAISASKDDGCVWAQRETEEAKKQDRSHAAYVRKSDVREHIKAQREVRLRQLERGCRVLKRTMEQASDKSREQLLYRFELQSRRAQKHLPLGEKTFSHLYSWVSDYGASMVRPFLALGVIIGAFAVAFYVWGLEVDPVALKSDGVNGLFQALDLSWSNVFKPLSALSTDNDFRDKNTLAFRLLYDVGGGVDGVGFAVRAVSTFQSLLALVLAFLFALAVRRRFQIS